MRLSEENITGSRTARGSSVKIILGMVLTAALLAGCSTQQASSTSDWGSDDYVQVCQDPETGVRVDDSKCDENTNNGNGNGGSSSSPFMWYFFSAMLLNQNRMNMPSIGSPLSGGYNYNQYSNLSNKGSYYRGVPSGGGTFSRNTATKAPVFDNSKMLKVPGDFRPPTAAPAPAPSAATPADKVTTAPAPKVTTAPVPKSTPAPAPKVPAAPKAPAYKAPAAPKAPTKSK